MAKKENKSILPRFSIFKKAAIALSVIIGAGVVALIWEEGPWNDLKESIYTYVTGQDVATWELKYSPEQLMALHKDELLGQEIPGKDKKIFREASLLYAPYLLLDVKYTEERKTREGFLLWGLIDGEIVLNTDTWEMTHGFKDCMDAGANRGEFKLIQLLAKKQGGILQDDLQRELNLDREQFLRLIEQAKHKHLVVQKGQQLHLHFENPKFVVIPQTRMTQQMVSKPLLESQKIGRVYNRSAVKVAAKAAFGEDFKIRSEKEIFLPVCRLHVLNPDGSVYATDWNALTGQRIKGF